MRVNVATLIQSEVKSIAQLLRRFRWLKFGVVGVVGTFIHFALLYTLTDVVGLVYILSAILSVVVASTVN